MKNTLFCKIFLASCIALSSCQDKVDRKFDKNNLTMNLGDAQGSVANQEALEMRCLCPYADKDSPLYTRIEQDNIFAQNYNKLLVFSTSVLTNPISEIQNKLPLIDSRIQEYLSAFQNDASYQYMANWAGLGVVKGYFLRAGKLNDTQKGILSKYMDLLIAQKNANMHELVLGLQELEGFWTKPRVKSAAEAILANENLYSTQVLDTSIGNISTNNLSGNELIMVEAHKAILKEHELAKQQLREIIDRN